MNEAEIVSFIEEMEQSAKAIKNEILTLCWFMRGSISYDDAMMLSPEDRDIIGKIVKGNIETTKKSGMPFF